MSKAKFPDKMNLPTKKEMEEECLKGLTPRQKKWAKEKIASDFKSGTAVIYKYIRLQAQSEVPLYLIVRDHGDPYVGIFPQSWEVQCPFRIDDAEKEALEMFRNKIQEAYQEFCEGRVSADYDFETDDDPIPEDYIPDQTEPDFPVKDWDDDDPLF